MTTATITRPTIHECKVRFLSTMAAARSAVDQFIERAADHGLLELNALRHGVHEAVSNAVMHGNQCDPRRTVKLSYSFAGDRAFIRVEDEGCGFAPSDVSDPTSEQGRSRPGGRGLLLMEHFMDSVNYASRGNVVELRKACTRIV